MNKTIIPATYESPKVEEMTLEIEGAILNASDIYHDPFEDGGSIPF